MTNKIDIKAPAFPESVEDGELVVWHKKAGDLVRRDEALADIETDKVTMEVVAPTSGRLIEQLKESGSLVLSEELIARLEPQSLRQTEQDAASAQAPAEASDATVQDETPPTSPAARRNASSLGVDLGDLTGSGKDGRVLREDALSHSPAQAPDPVSAASDRPQRRTRMSRLRARIAERLLSAQHNAAMLTTFNEVNMQPLIAVRQQLKEEFSQRYKVKLGFMGFFSRAVCMALEGFPAINASLDGDEIVYHGYVDISIAVSLDEGLVTPVLRDAQRLDVARIERQISSLATLARDGKLSLDDLNGGTFTITNGGVFGSLLSTPILNPPQTAILGMHSIQERAVVEEGVIVARPMMYLALSYDHRLVDGRDAVKFLVEIKRLIEQPSLLLLGGGGDKGDS